MGKICYFAGHRDTFGEEDLYSRIISLAEKLIVCEDVTEFRVGRSGNFDKLAARAIEELRKLYPVKLIIVIPYLTKDVDKDSEKFFDEIIIADIPPSTPHRYRIIRCNEYSVKSADFLICYIPYTWGGAWKTAEYARRKGVTVYKL